MTPAFIDEDLESYNVMLTDTLNYIERVMLKEFSDAVEIHREIHEVIQEMIFNGTKLIGCGTTRIVFDYDEKNIVKIPFTWNGFMASSREVKAFKDYTVHGDIYVPMAECFFAHEDTSLGKISGIFMEKVNIFPIDYKKLPGWVSTVDCGQVGYNRQNELVAYDL